jgi:hypothetical protein
MAGDWIKMRTLLANDPAVIAIALDLDKSEFEIVGMLHHLWSWADSQSQDGHIKRVTEKWIDRYVHQSGFAKSMSDVGWLVIENDGITFPSFDKHNGESAKKRAEAAERKRISRANKSSGVVTDASQISCDKSVTREEKRREEKIQDQKQKHCAQGKPERVKSITLKQLVGMGVDEQHAKDWLVVRKSKRATLTPTALEGVQREAYKAGITLAQAIERAANNNWAGFKASWQEVNHGTNTGGGRQGSPSLVEQVREHNRRAEAARGDSAPGSDASVVAVDGEVVGADDQHVWPQMDLGARTGGR